MSEKRRLFVDQNRLIDQLDSNRKILLNTNESHYLSRVLRMRSGDLLAVVDGKGHLWNAEIVGEKIIRLTTKFDSPIQRVSRDKPLICIAVAMPKKGFESFLQMSCEIGVDVIQPLISKRSVVKGNSNEKIKRWEKIICEAVEQSERLWKPELRQTLKLQKWINYLPPDAHVAFASTRIDELQDCLEWLNDMTLKVNQTWIAIGPEGGWDKDEENFAFENGLVGISIGDTILRTSTAAVSACQLMILSRRLKSCP